MLPCQILRRISLCQMKILTVQTRQNCRTVVTSTVHRSGKKPDNQSSNQEDKQESPVDPRLEDAARSVASSLTGDPKKTESDLLSQLRAHAKSTDVQKTRETTSPPAPSMRDLFTGMHIEKGNNLSLASSSAGDPKKTESDLLSQLGDHAKSTDVQETRESTSPPAPSMADLFAGMQIEKETKDGQSKDVKGWSLQSRARESFERRSALQNLTSRKRLFDGPGLGIFTKMAPQEEIQLEVSSPESLWDVVEREELEQLLSAPPSNSFEEMIRWTKEGKLWHFPINNEQGIFEETKVGFHEHVFFDDLLKEFPSKGPIRHFMELVTTGLSKNPYITALEKREHILWFKDYFEDKQHILDDVLETSK